MGSHLVDGEFKSDKYAWCPPGFVALKLTDKDAQPFLWGYAQTHRARDGEFTDDLEAALRLKGFEPPDDERDVRYIEQVHQAWGSIFTERLKWLIAREAVLRPEEVVANAAKLTDLYIDLVFDKYRAFRAKADALRRGLLRASERK